MKALWIRVEAHEVDSVRIERLAEALDVDVVTALGHYVALGGAIAEHAPEGIISEISDLKLERWAKWTGKRGRFAAAIRQQLQNEYGEFSDWEDSMGKLVERRAADRKRTADRREKIRAERAKSGGNDRQKSTDNPPPVREQSTDNHIEVRGQSADKGQKSGATERNGTDGTDGKSGSGMERGRQNGSASASLRSGNGTAGPLPTGCLAFLDRFYPVRGRRRADVERQLTKLAAGDSVTDGKKQQVRAYSPARLDEKCLEVLEESAQIRDLDKAIVVLFTKLGDTSDGAAPGQREAADLATPDVDELAIDTWIRAHPAEVEDFRAALTNGGRVDPFAEATIDAQVRARVRERLHARAS